MSRFRKHIPSAASKGDGGKIFSSLLKQARKTGQLNLSNRELQVVPNEVWNVNKPPSDEDKDFNSADGEKWWDQVELTKLILASNSLTSLAENIGEFSSLVILDVHDNKLKEVPDAVGNLMTLEKLDLSHNEIVTLPENLSNLQGISVVFLQHNHIQRLPNGIGSLVSLQNLDLSHNQLESLPEDMASMGKLQKLNLSNNKLKHLPNDVCRLNLLVYLDLNSNSLSTLPGNLGDLKSLQQLHLRNNLLANVPSLSKCQTMKELYCASNQVKSLDASNLPSSLVILEMRDNKIEIIEKRITEMKELQRLDLSNNNISSLPPEIGLMEQIKVINVDGNPMRGIRRDIIAKGTQAIMKYLRTRIVASNGDNNSNSSSEKSQPLPSSESMVEVSKKHSLSISKKLDLSKTGWSAKCEQQMDDYSDIDLETIILSRMTLDRFPGKICHFQSSLKILNLSTNKLSSIPAEIGVFKSLTHLDLSSNCLSDLPSEMSALQDLIELNIFQNRFTHLPKCLFQLLKLEHLLAGGNQMTDIDVTSLQKLPVLSTLALQNNNISKVPPELGRLTSIRSLQLDGNMFRMPRQNILQQGTQAIMEYLRDRLPNS